MVTCSSTCTGTQAQGLFLVYLTSCARSTGLGVSQASTKPALFVLKSGKERQIYLWDPFPSQEVSTHWAFRWLMPGDISEGTARIGAISMSPASIGGCLKQESSRICLWTWKPQSCADHFLVPHKHLPNVIWQITSLPLLFILLNKHHPAGSGWDSTITTAHLNAQPLILSEFRSTCRADMNNAHNLLEKLIFQLQWFHTSFWTWKTQSKVVLKCF